MLVFINILELVYPVGSFFISNNNVSPAESIGGTWTQIENAVLRGAASTGYTGTDTHSITSNEMPAHKHSASTASAGSHTHTQHSQTWYNNSNYDGWVAKSGGGFYAVSGISQKTASAGGHTHTMTIGNTGGGRLCRSSNALTTALFGIARRRLAQEDVI